MFKLYRLSNEGITFIGDYETYNAALRASRHISLPGGSYYIKDEFGRYFWL